MTSHDPTSLTALAGQDPPPAPPLRRLRAGLALLRRDERTWQIGIDPATAVLVRDADPATVRGLHSLDRWHHPGTDPADHALVPPGLLAELDRLGLLAPDPCSRDDDTARWHGRHFADTAASGLAGAATPGRRRRAQVTVEGTGPVAALVATGLAGAGVGTVVTSCSHRPVCPQDLTPAGPWEPDLGRPWCEAVADAVRALNAQTTPGPGALPDLVVLTQTADADAPWCDPEHGDPWLRAGVCHIAVSVAGRGAQIGQVVVPGRTACLRCRELTRTEQDPSWPVLAAQLRRRGNILPTGQPPMALSGPLAGVAAALGVGRALAHLEHRCDDEDPHDVLLWLPSLGIDRRAVRRHRTCGCHWPLALGTMAT